jgi:hypothetical protein
MEDQYTQDPTPIAVPQASSYVPQQPKAKNNGSKWVIIFIVLLILGGAGIFFFTSSANKPIATPTPSFGVVPIENVATLAPTPAVTSTPAPIKRDEITIEIKNGTGIPGEAKLLSDKLKALGYSEITAGNAETTDYTETTVTFLKTLSQTAQDEIKKELDGFYKTVNVKTSSTQKSDVVVITGLRGTQTTKPASTSSSTSKSSATPTAKSSSSPTASPKSSASPSATPKVN